MAKRKNYGVLTLSLQGQDSGLSQTMNKAGKATSKYTGTIDGLNNTYSNLSAKLGLVGGAMTMAAKAGTVLLKGFDLLTKSGDAYLTAVDSIQETMTSLPFGLGEAARASFELGEAFGIMSTATQKKLAGLKDVVADIKEELQGLNAEVWKSAKGRQADVKLTAMGMSDKDIADQKKHTALMALALDEGGAAYARAVVRIETERNRIEKELRKGGQDILHEWFPNEPDAIDKSAQEVMAIRTSIIEDEQSRVDLARAQMKRENDNRKRVQEREHEGKMQEVFRDNLRFQLEQKLGKGHGVDAEQLVRDRLRAKIEKKFGEGAGAELAGMVVSKADMRPIVADAYKAAVKLAQEERAKVDLAETLGIDVAGLSGLDPKLLRRKMLSQRRVAMSDIDQRAKSEVGRMLIAAEHMADAEAKRLAQERESVELGKVKKAQQESEASRGKELVRLTRLRTSATRELLSAQRMSMGDQFTFQGVIGTMRISDTSDTNRLQVAHTEALERVNRTLLNIDGQLETIAT